MTARWENREALPFPARGGRSAQWLDQPDRQSILVAPGDQCNPSIGAQRRIGVSLREANALSGKLVERRSSVIGLTGAAEVGVTAVVHDNEQDVGDRKS